MVYLYYLDVIVQRNQTKWLAWRPFIWGFTLEGDYTGLIDSGYTTDEIQATNLDNLVGVTVDDRVYSEVSTIAELIATPETFYFDLLTQVVEVHFRWDATPWYFNTIRLDNNFNLLKSPLSPLDFDGIINNVPYDFRLLNAPVVNDELDDVFFSQLKTFTTKITLNNSDGFLNDWATDNDVYGNAASLYLWFGENIADFDPDDSERQWSGYIGKTKTGRKLIIDINDSRKKLDISTPSRVLDLTNWTDAEIPISIPEVWGRCTRIPLSCLNPNEVAPTNFLFMVADVTYYNIDSVRAVYIDRKSYTTSPTTGTSVDDIFYVSIPATEFSDGSGGFDNLDKVSATVWGYEDPDTDVLIQNPLDVIRVRMKELYNQDYTADYFDLTNWAAAHAIAFDINYYIDSPIQFRTQIERLAGATLGRFTISVDQKYQFFIYDASEASVATIEKWKFLPQDYFPTVERDPDRTLATVRISYDRDWSKDKDSESAFAWYRNTDNYNQVIALTGSGKSKDFKTLLHYESDAILFANEINSVYGIIFETFQVTVKSEYLSSVSAGQFIDVEADLPDDDLLGWKKCQILSKQPNTDDNTTQVFLRIIGDVA